MEIYSVSPSQTKELAFRIAKELTPGSVIALYGDLGAGKTTFVKALAEFLGIKQPVLSPTFVLSRVYDIDNAQKLVHFDLYRLQTSDEAFELGLEELFASKDSIVVIEWPEIINDRLPADTKKIHISIVGDDKRHIVIG